MAGKKISKGLVHPGADFGYQKLLVDKGIGYRLGHFDLFIAVPVLFDVLFHWPARLKISRHGLAVKTHEPQIPLGKPSPLYRPVSLPSQHLWACPN